MNKQAIARSGQALPTRRHTNGGRSHFGRYQASKDEVSNQLFDGADLEKFRLKLHQEAFLAKMVVRYYVFLITVKGENPTAEAIKGSGIVRKAVSDVILEAHAKNARRIVIPMSNSGENTFKPIIEQLINRYGRECIPAAVSWKWDFEIAFVGGPSSNPVLRLPEAAPSTALPAPAESESFDQMEEAEEAAAA